MSMVCIYLFQADQALANITKCCDGGDGNLLHLCIEAARARCTVEEITTAKEKVGTHDFYESDR